MANPFFQAMGTGTPNLMQMLQQFRANPVQFLAQRNINIPANMGNDPNAILQHLMSTGRVNQQQVNSAYQIAQRLGLK